MTLHAPRGVRDLRPICRRAGISTTSVPAVTCDDCLYVVDVRRRALEFQAALGYGAAVAREVRRLERLRSALSVVDVREYERNILDVAHVAGHFACRLLEEAAA